MQFEKEPILYIDDEAENLRGFQFVYKQYYRIFIANSAAEGLEILKNNTIKVILADQRMPEMTGVEFFEKAAALYPDIIRIIITGFTDIEAIIRAINTGKIFKYLTKPWDKDDLKLVLDNALWSFNISEQNRQLINQLQEANTTLEQKVAERTEQIRKQNVELEVHRTNLELLVEERTTDLIKAKEKAELSDKLKSAFLANLSHEIRTPMNAIMGFSQLMLEDSIPLADKKDFVSLIITNSQHLLNLINEIIDISRIEAGELTLHLAPCNLTNMLNDILLQYEDQKHLSGKSNIDIRISKLHGSADIIVATDCNKLKQIIINLLENALKFTEEGSIEFGITDKYKDINDLVIFVKDTGIGIDLEASGFIFERFRKVENEKADKLYRGAGLGLAISKRLVEFLGGRIWVESELHKGSTFYITIPVANIVSSVGLPVTSVSKPILVFNWAHKSILIAEDELANFRYIEKVLEKTKIKLMWAKNGLEACEMFKSNPNIDLILMDIRMPVMDGYEAIKRIREQNTQLPIIVQTAYTLDFEKEEILKTGCSDYISKPYSEADLLTKIDKYIE